MNKERSIQRFGEKLHTLRTTRGLTLTELAHQLGHVAHGYISELETGKKLPGIEFVLSVARLFDISTDELLKDELELINLDATQALDAGLTQSFSTPVKKEQRTGEVNHE